MKRYFYSNDGKNTEGPLTLEELAALSQTAAINERTMVIPEDSSSDWAPFQQLMSGATSGGAPAPTLSPPAEQSTALTTTTMNHQYKVIVLTTGCFTQTLDPQKLQATLNQEAKEGWRFAKSIHEEKKILGIFSREAHFLIFERGA